MMYGPGYGYGYGMMGGGDWLGGLFMLLFFLLLGAAFILLVVWAVRSSHKDSPTVAPPASRSDDAVAIARRRFASGEITKDEFDELMRALGA